MIKESFAGQYPQLKPTILWSEFEAISRIPRCSGNEKQVLSYIESIAIARNREAIYDQCGNLLIRLPGKGVGASRDPLCLQSHVDMVCEKNKETVHNFESDPVNLRMVGSEVKATDTTLGADNGIGVASMVALMKDEISSHPPLELLFTIDEERGLTGARLLSQDLLKARRLINTDTEEEGVFYIGCAGGADSTIQLPAKKEKPRINHFIKFTVKGLSGGHSGIDIHRGRANALQVVARMVATLGLSFDYRVAFLEGGDKRNAICREATVGLEILSSKKKMRSTDEGDSGHITMLLENEFEQIKREYQGREFAMVLKLEAQGPVDRVLDELTSYGLISIILTVPHGPIAFHPEIAELVETSNNVASVQERDDHIAIHIHTRSSVDGSVESFQNMVEAIVALHGASLRREESYPGWQPNLQSTMLAIAQRVYREKNNNEAAIRAIHAGLETGAIAHRYPDMDMISMGPDIRHPHSPDESVDWASVERYWELLLAILESVP